MLNIAEGSAKFSEKERRQFYVTARGSAFECAALLNFLHGENELHEDLMKTLYPSYMSICKMLFAMIKNLEQKL
jgi:four helix bundle protein